MVDWEKLKTEYITTDISYRQMAEKYHMRMATIADRAKQGSWVAERNKYRDKVVAQALRKQANKESNRLARITSTSDRFDGVIEKMMEAFECDDMTTSASADLNNFVKAYKDVVMIKRNLYGILTKQEQAKIDLEREKLQLERDKFEEEKRKYAEAQTADKTVNIVLSSDAERYAE